MIDFQKQRFDKFFTLCFMFFNLRFVNSYKNFSKYVIKNGAVTKFPLLSLANI